MKQSFENVQPFDFMNYPEASLRRVIGALREGQSRAEVERIAEEERARYWSGTGYDPSISLQTDLSPAE